MAESAPQDLRGLGEALRSLEAQRQSMIDRIRTIEDRRATTAPAIFERVRRETEDKLRGVDADVASVRTQLEKALERAAGAATGGDAARLGEELEEIRFRNTLGEYTPEEFQRIEGEKVAQIQQASAGGPPPEAAELRALVDRLAHVNAPAAVPAAAASPAPAPDVPPTRAIALPSIPPVPPPPGPTGPRPMSSDLEALFGSAPPASPTSAPSPAVRDDATRRREVPAAAGVTTEETTQDLGIRAVEDRVREAPAAGAVFRPVLIVKTKDKDRGEDTYDLSPGQTLIGRAPENDIILLEESVSRRHARLVVEGGGCQFEDLGSANGSFVNGEKIRPKQPKALQDNDVIKMGQLLALYRAHPDD